MSKTGTMDGTTCENPLQVERHFFFVADELLFSKVIASFFSFLIGPFYQNKHRAVIFEKNNQTMSGLVNKSVLQKVRIIYNTYNDFFDLVDGSLSVEKVDEEYCFSDVMPGCTIHLSKTTPVSVF
jgi:hypothetical protein